MAQIQPTEGTQVLWGTGKQGGGGQLMVAMGGRGTQLHHDRWINIIKKNFTMGDYAKGGYSRVPVLSIQVGLRMEGAEFEGVGVITMTIRIHKRVEDDRVGLSKGGWGHMQEVVLWGRDWEIASFQGGSCNSVG
eukprot:763695-Hanusia_phi.AAC.3